MQNKTTTFYIHTHTHIQIRIFSGNRQVKTLVNFKGEECKVAANKIFPACVGFGLCNGTVKNMFSRLL